MIKAEVGDTFPIVVSLFDEITNQLASGESVYFDIRHLDDSILSPALNGYLTESTVQSGIYKGTTSISEAGIYICYATCSGFLTSTEEIIINETNIYTMAASQYHYNISVEEVKRTNETPTSSQTSRKVPISKPDYIITRIKSNDASDWSMPVASGTTWMHYHNITDSVPYKVGAES